MKFVILLLCLFSVTAFAAESECYGTTSAGSLEDGALLPAEGNNFVGYSTIARLAGRTYVHSEVREIIVSAYAALESEQPDKVYKYGETGFKKGGKFRPHKTHQNGLSVDFMVPVINEKGESVHFPTHPFNKFGYNVEFDSSGQYKSVNIDYEAMAAHIVALHKASKQRGHDIWRVIFAPELQPPLYTTQYDDYLREHIQFSKKSSWVRHDEHYHVDFIIPCGTDDVVNSG